MAETGHLFAVSDLHVRYPENRAQLHDLRPTSPHDWLLVAGDVSERFAEVQRTLEVLRDRFAKVFWAPGNHELWTLPGDPVQLRGRDRYDALVDMCRAIGVVTPEDPYEVWTGPGGPVAVVPLFLLYDYTFLPSGAATKEQGLAKAEAAGVLCTDEVFLHPDPYPSREEWCAARLNLTRPRLDALELSTVLFGHYPLIRKPMDVLWHPEFVMWCGTVHTADWHRRYRATSMVYGHLHVPSTFDQDGTEFQEVSLGYPQEWGARDRAPSLPRRIL
jgi:3',5'-cyclic AMP phosphodiesterase CpdA